MPSIAVLGATGNLGRCVVDQALADGWAVSVAVRHRGRLAPHVASRAQVTDLDLASATTAQVAAFAGGHDVFVCCAGMVTEGEAFVRLVDHVVTALESLDAQPRRAT